METKAFALPRNERLKSRLAIDSLFSGANPSVTAFPLKVVYRIFPDGEAAGSVPDAQCRILVSVSKRHFKRAVRRNRIKRQIRECYRLEKHHLPAGSTIHMAFLWLCNRELPTMGVRERMVRLLHKVAQAAVPQPVEGV